jgi:hypothetical protein
MDKFIKEIISAIKKDNGLSYKTNDWWTSYTDKDGKVYDVNVYSNEYADCADDEFTVSVYDCYEGEDGYYFTDYAYNYPSFTVKKEMIIK